MAATNRTRCKAWHQLLELDAHDNELDYSHQVCYESLPPGPLIRPHWHLDIKGRLVHGSWTSSLSWLLRTINGRVLLTYFIYVYAHGPPIDQALLIIVRVTVLAKHSKERCRAPSHVGAGSMQCWTGAGLDNCSTIQPWWPRKDPERLIRAPIVSSVGLDVVFCWLTWTAWYLTQSDMLEMLTARCRNSVVAGRTPCSVPVDIRRGQTPLV